jgi:hypothetical protein
MAMQDMEASRLEQPAQLLERREGRPAGYIQALERHIVVSEVSRAYVPAILRHGHHHLELPRIEKPGQVQDVDRAATAG